MPKFSVIVPVLNEEKYLPKALDSLIHQTSEDFEVVIVDGGSTDGSLALAREAVEKYVGFYLIEETFPNRYAAMNRGLRAAEGDYVIFLSARDYMTDETVEELIKHLDGLEKTPDVLVFRNYLFGEGHISHFSEYDDLLAPVPEFPKYENLVLRILHIEAKAFRRAFLENRRIEFGENDAFEDMRFAFRCFRDAKLASGCPYAVYETLLPPAADAAAGRRAPTLSNLRDFIGLWNDIYAAAYDKVLGDGEGVPDGSESYLQEVLYRSVCELLERFYIKYWFLDEETYRLFHDEYNDRMNRLVKEKHEKLQQMFGWLGAPYIFAEYKDASFLCSMALKFEKKEDYAPFIDSLYAQRFPFFEAFVDAADADAVPEKYDGMANLHAIESDNFFAAARQTAQAQIFLVVRDPKPLDENVLKNLRGSKAPVFLRQTAFARIRKALSLRGTLRDKGMDLAAE
ncbi:MAG: glycosyltransferase family 2 protein [Clostridia bacterium]|nr:glycosyltransferase family 2 protein [Clostridia bacterium]